MKRRGNSAAVSGDQTNRKIWLGLTFLAQKRCGRRQCPRSSNEGEQPWYHREFHCRNPRWRIGRDNPPFSHGIRAGGMDLQSILANVGGGGVGGAIVMAVIGIIKNKMAQK
jgi:hypothetical protein